MTAPFALLLALGALVLRHTAGTAIGRQAAVFLAAGEAVTALAFASRALHEDAIALVLNPAMLAAALLFAVAETRHDARTTRA